MGLVPVAPGASLSAASSQARALRKQLLALASDGVSYSVARVVASYTPWQELVDITDKTQLEWREVFQDLNHHGVYHSGEVVGLGNLVCEKCHYHLAVYTPDVLPRCPKCGHDQFQRRPFEP